MVLTTEFAKGMCVPYRTITFGAKVQRGPRQNGTLSAMWSAHWNAQAWVYVWAAINSGPTPRGLGAHQKHL